MPCFFLINFTEDIEIDGMLVFFLLSSKKMMTAMATDHSIHTQMIQTKTHQSLLITIPIGDDDAGH